MITVEDGSIVANANSYVTIAEVRTYAGERGITLPADDAEVEPLIHLAMDWFEANEFKGTRTDTETPQPLSFPRKGLQVDGITYADNLIPARVKNCINQAACDANTITLQPTYAGSAEGQVKRKKLDVMEKEFFAAEWQDKVPFLGKLQSLIGPLLGSGLSSGRLTVARV